MEIFGQIPIQLILFFVLYGVTGVVPLIAALYLLLRRGNVFAPDITPPVRLRRWAASFFVVAALAHVWWLLFYFYSRDLHLLNVVAPSKAYVVVVMLDCVTQLTTFAGTLLSMLQDRRRPIWPIYAGMLPLVALWGVLMVYPSQQILLIAISYVLLFYALFTVYMVFAVRRYGQWLYDNYADLENKKVWLCQMVTLGCFLLFLLYTLVGFDALPMLFVLHFTELMLFGLLLWRVETLPQLDSIPLMEMLPPPDSTTAESTDTSLVSRPLETPEAPETTEVIPTATQTSLTNINLAKIERLLAEHCVDTQLYLQHDLTLHQLSQTIGTNRFYLSQYFSCKGITYNTYINNLRINHFIRRYQELAADGQPISAQQLASASGYRSYSTFSLAFKQRMGQNVTAWLRERGGVIF